MIVTSTLPTSLPHIIKYHLVLSIAHCWTSISTTNVLHLYWMGVGWLMDGLMCCGVVLCTLHYPTQTEKMMNKAHSYLDITLVNNLVCLPTCLPALHMLLNQRINSKFTTQWLTGMTCFAICWVGWVGLGWWKIMQHIIPHNQSPYTQRMRWKINS